MSHEFAMSGSGRLEPEEISEQVHDMLLELLGEGRDITRTHGGAYFADEENPGKFIHEVVTSGGMERFSGAMRTTDYQSGPIGTTSSVESIRSERTAPPAVPATAEDCWAQAGNCELPSSDRVQALQECRDFLVPGYRQSGVRRAGIDRYRDRTHFNCFHSGNGKQEPAHR